MERGTESRSERPRRENGSGEQSTPAEPPTEPGFVETSEIQFDFSQRDNDAPESPSGDRTAEPFATEPSETVEPPTAAPDSAGRAPPTAPNRDARAARVDREIPAPPPPPPTPPTATAAAATASRLTRLIPPPRLPPPAGAATGRS